MRTQLAAFFLLGLIAIPCVGQTFTVSPVTNCPDDSHGIQFTLTAGTHYLQWVSGAYSPTPYDYDCTGFCAYWAAWVFVHIGATGETLRIGAPFNVWPSLYDKYYPTYEVAEATAIGTYSFELASNSTVSFYLLDDYYYAPPTCTDNRGLVTLALDQPTPTKPLAWGAIKALYR